MPAQPSIESPLQEFEGVLFGGDPIIRVGNICFNEGARQAGGRSLALPELLLNRHAIEARHYQPRSRCHQRGGSHPGGDVSRTPLR
jgi:hypothetical protein